MELFSQEQNPFASPRSQGPDPAQNQQPTPLDTLEFNGFITIDGETRVSVTDTKEKRSYWLKKGESLEDGLRLNLLDMKNEVIIVARGGQTKELRMKEVSITPLKVATLPANVPGAAQGPAVSPPNNQPRRNNAVSQESDEEVQERMRRVAEEIRRRRAERRARIEERNNSAGD